MLKVIKTCMLIVVFILYGCEAYKSKVQPQPPAQLEINEGFNQPLGFYDANPRFSWVLSAHQKIKMQTHYRIVVASSPSLLPNKPDLWDSQKVASQQSTFVPYAGLPLGSKQKVYWQVRYWGNESVASSWSNTHVFELGLLSNQDWQAQWIEIKPTQPIKLNRYNTPIHIPQHLRKEFNANKKIQKARLYITAKGIFEAFINGMRIGDDVLTPGYTPYKKRIETLTYDVTQQVQTGKNAIGIQLAEGWYAGRFGPKRHWHKKLNLTPKVLAQLELTFDDGSTQKIITDKTWRATQNGPVRTSGLYDGETYDANYALGDWHQVGFNDTAWSDVVVSPINSAVKLEPKRHFTSKNKEVLPTLSIQQVGGKTIFDLGQNMVGVPKIRIPMLKGKTLNLRFGEGVNKDGSLFTKNLGSAKQLDFYTASQDGVVEWQPQFTFHGFRYVEISGFDTRFTPQKEWVSGIVQYTDFDVTGSFTSSHSELNQFQSNIEWGLKGNFLDIPTDCPQRAERLGWTGDALAFATTSLFIADSHAFWAAWMQSIREEQFENHGIPVVVPNEVGEIVQAGWSDAAVTIPWDVYTRTGDKTILADNYAMMTRWIKYHQTQLKNGISEMWTVGDWLQPYSTRKDSRRGQTDHSLISTAFYARSVELTRNTARVLGKTDDAMRYSTLYNTIKARFQAHFFDDNGRLQVGEQTQTSYLLAIGFDLLDAPTMQKAIPHLLATFDAANGHLRTGFLGTPLIAPVLDKVGRADVAFDLVFKQSYPSWLFSVTQGATTVWERWDGFTYENGYAKKAGSLNHYAYGAIGQWMYDRIVGISPLQAGYKKILIAPLITEHLEFAQGEFQSPYGLITSHWKKQKEGTLLNINIPTSTTAIINIPMYEYTKNKQYKKLGENVYLNGKKLAVSDFVEQNNSKVKTISVTAGAYKIEVK